MKKILLVTLIFILIIIFVSYKNTEKSISGTISDCINGQKIVGASIRIRQSGWGFDNYLVWDKKYEINTYSDQNGYFSTKTKFGKPSELLVTKDGYINALEWREINDKADIKLISDDAKSSSMKYSTNCVIQ